MPSLQANLALWNGYSWKEDGDEWADQAEFCGVPYAIWKQELVHTFILPHVSSRSTVLEIGSGHGRWSKLLSVLCGRFVGVDLSPVCVEFCKRVLKGEEFYVNDGSTLPMLDSSSVDFVWSFDTFVHVEMAETESYLREIARVLKPEGNACIHHPGSPTREKGGWRSAVTAEVFAASAQKAGFQTTQRTSWGLGGRCNTDKFGDCISTLHL